MAIEVGALSLAIEAGIGDTLAGFKKVDQAGSALAAKQQAHNDAIADATRKQREAKRALITLQNQQNAALKVMTDRLEQGLSVTRDMQRAFDKLNKPIASAQKNVADTTSARNAAIELRNADRESYRQAKADLNVAKGKTAELRKQLAAQNQIARVVAQQARSQTSAAQAAVRLQAAQSSAARAAANAAAAQTRAQTAQIRQQQLMARNAQRGPGTGGRQTTGTALGGGGPSLLGIGAGLLGGVSITAFLDTVEDFQRLQQRLKQVTTSGEEVKILFDRLSTSAQNLRVPVSDLGELFVKLRQSNSQLGLTYGQTAKLTEAFSAALRLSGASGQGASSALLQFGQAMAKGRLDGDEFTTVAENASEVLRILERQTGKTRGQLIDMRKSGQLTAQMLADSLLLEADALQKKIAQLPPTIDQAKTSFRNSVVQMIGGSKDLQVSMENLARSIISIGNFLAENGPVIVGLAALAAKLWAVWKVIGAIKAIGGLGGIASSLSALLANPILAGIGVIASAGLIGYEWGQQQRKAAEQAFQERINAEAAGYNALIKQREQSEEKLAAVIRLRGRNSPEAMNAAAQMIDVQQKTAAQTKKIEADYTRSMTALGRAQINAQVLSSKGYSAQAEAARKTLGKAQQDYAAAKGLYDKTVLVQSTMAKGGSTPQVIPPKVSGGAASDPTNSIIAAAKQLAERGKLLESDYNTLQKIQAKERDIASDVKQTTQRRAEAEERVKNIADVMAILYFENQKVSEGFVTQSDRVDMLVKNYDSLTQALKNYADQLIREEIKSLSEKLHEEMRAMTAQNDRLKERIELMDRIKGLQEQLNKTDSEKMGTGGKTEGEKDPKGKKDKLSDEERHIERLQRQLLDIFVSAPGALITTYFDAIAQNIADGGKHVGEAMRSALGGIFKNIGQNLIEQGMTNIWMVIKKAYGKLMLKMGTATSVFGKFLTGIKKALSNPLIAGPALIALGIGLAAYGSKMGAIGSGSSGSEGTIGNLGVGSQASQAQIYRFGDRRNPLEGNRVTGERDRSIVVNQTIIGANDPVAQRQIGDLVNNAARRGIIKRNG